VARFERSRGARSYIFLVQKLRRVYTSSPVFSG
jgi:hypothetical protein